MILVELITLQNCLKMLGYDATFSTPGGGHPQDECKVTEHDRMILGGLMKRLLNQIPVHQKGQKYTVKDFNSKMTNLYLLLDKEHPLRMHSRSRSTSKLKRLKKILIPFVREFFRAF